MAWRGVEGKWIEKLGGLREGSEGVAVSHPQFAYDSILLLSNDRKNVLLLLQIFKMVSGAEN